MIDSGEPLDRDRWLSEDEAHRLLARAVELDAKHRASVSVDDLRKAAGEAGIGSAAFLQALDEVRSGALEPSTLGERLSGRLAAYRRPAALGAFIAAAGITPGDAVGLALILGSGLYGVFEGVTGLIRLFGRTSPRPPPSSPRATTDVGGHRLEDRPRERGDTRSIAPRMRLGFATGSSNRPRALSWLGERAAVRCD